MNNTACNTKEKQKALLEMMKDIHAFCHENQINYSLAYGSLLGAVRHNGFIPWDDDLDIIMDRKNYEKFLLAADKINDYKIVPVLWINRIKKDDDDSTSLETPTIDIFVFDNTPHKKIAHKLKLGLLCLLQGMMHEKANTEKGSTMQKLMLFVCFAVGKLLPFSVKFRLYNRAAQLGNNSPCSTVSIYNGEFSHIFKNFDKPDFQNVTPHKFEDTEFYILDNYDHILTTLYGDYMTPPPECERIPKHKTN